MADVVEQYETLLAAVAPIGVVIEYVKPHGALYNDMTRSVERAGAVLEAMGAVGNSILVAQLLGPLDALAAAAGVRLVREAFPDRGYLNDGRLAPREEPGAVIHDVHEAVRRASSLATTGLVHSLDGTPVAVAAETLCVHGDAGQAAARARALRTALETAGVSVNAFARS